MSAKKSFLVLSLIIFISSICGTAIAAEPNEIEKAIDSGISWLVAQQQGDGSWFDPSYGQPVACTGFAVTTLADRAFKLAIEPNSNINPQLGPFDPNYPYKNAIESGLNFIFQNGFVVDIYDQPAGKPDSDDDSNGVRFGGEYRTIYSTGICMMAIAATRAPDRVVNVLGSEVNGWTYKEVLVDMVDYMAFGQCDSGNSQGGWDYAENCGAAGRADNSNTGYAVIGLAYAESPAYYFNCTIPQFVKDELSIWIDYIQSPDGGSGYLSPGTSNVLRTGNLILQMHFAGESPIAPNVHRALDYIGRTWNNSSQDPGWGNPSNPHCQSAFCVMRGLEYAGIAEIVVDGSLRDWYADLADALVNAQDPCGFWPGSSEPYGGDVLATEWALLTLGKLFPKRVPTLTKINEVNDGDCVGPGDEITYTICYSYADDPNLPVINDVNIIDYLPDEVEPDDPSDTNYNSDDHTYTWSIGTISPGDADCFTLTVKVKECFVPCSTIRNCCEIKSGDTPYNTASKCTPVCVVGYDVVVLEDNPLIYFRFEEEIASNAPVTNSANSLNALTVDAKYFGPDPLSAPGKMGKGVFLHGKGEQSGECVVIHSPGYTGGDDYSHSYALTPGDMTVEVWFKTRPHEEYGEGGPFGWARMFSNNGTWEYREAARTYITESEYVIGAGSQGTQEKTYMYLLDPSYDPCADPCSTGPGDGNWHHVVSIFDCNDANPNNSPLLMQFYLDGALLGERLIEPNETLQTTGVLGPEYKHFLIGSESSLDNLYNCLRGTIDSFALYDYVLPQDRVCVHYLEGMIAKPWQPENCEQIYRFGWNIPGDVNGDCYVDFADLKVLVDDWLKCNNPEDPNCTIEPCLQ